MDEHAVQTVQSLCTLGAVHNEYKNIVHLGGSGICELLVCYVCRSFTIPYTVDSTYPNAGYPDHQLYGSAWPLG
jgi:hypothetical protein